MFNFLRPKGLALPCQPLQDVKRRKAGLFVSRFEGLIQSCHASPPESGLVIHAILERRVFANLDCSQSMGSPDGLRRLQPCRTGLFRYLLHTLPRPLLATS